MWYRFGCCGSGGRCGQSSRTGWELSIPKNDFHERGDVMKIKDVMTTNVVCIRPEATIHEAAEQMRSLNVGLLPVCGPEDKLVGVLSDRDIVIRSTAGGNDPKAALVSEIMTQKVYYCLEEQDIAEAAKMMEQQQIRRLIVINDQKRLAGIVSLGDLAVKSDQPDLCEQTLEAVSVPAQPMR